MRLLLQRKDAGSGSYPVHLLAQIEANPTEIRATKDAPMIGVVLWMREEGTKSVQGVNGYIKPLPQANLFEKLAWKFNHNYLTVTFNTLFDGVLIRCGNRNWADVAEVTIRKKFEQLCPLIYEDGREGLQVFEYDFDTKQMREL